MVNVVVNDFNLYVNLINAQGGAEQMINKVILIGNTGANPEVRTLDGNIKVSTFTLATSESYKNKSGEKVTDVEWHKIVAWNKLAEIVEKYVSKEDKLFIEGKIKYRSYNDKDGVKKYITEIYADNIKILSPKSDSKSENKNIEIPPPLSNNFNSNPDDDLPY